MKHLSFKSIAEYHKYFDIDKPENPLFSIVHTNTEEGELSDCETHEMNETIALTCNFYSISFKKIISGELTYGRTKYDGSNGTLLFTAPNQSLVFRDMVFSSESYHIAFHKDYIRSLDIYNKIKKYNFFNYYVNEALHLSPKEEQIIKDLFNNIKEEYNTNQDEFSKEIIISQLETLLKYSDRFYKRQFLNRTNNNKILITKFKEILDTYFDQNLLVSKIEYSILKLDYHEPNKNDKTTCFY